MGRAIRTEGRRHVDLKAPVPGLAPRPPPPLPTTFTTTTAIDTNGSPVPTCASCAPLREALRQAHEQLLSAQTRINGAIILGKEAIQRSSVKVGAYDILDQVFRKHGIPFEDGRPLPDEYKNYVPVHKYEAGILQRAEGRAENTQSLHGSDSDGDHRVSNEAPSQHSGDSEESIPEGFSSTSNQGSCAMYEESDNDRDWELDPQALGDSEMGDSDVEDAEESDGEESDGEESDGEESDGEKKVHEDHDGDMTDAEVHTG